MTKQEELKRFEELYADVAPWDIDGAQQPFIDVADQVTGSVLDAGCGTGENAMFFAKRGLTVTGIDFLEFAVQRAKEKAAERGIAIELLQMDACRLTDWDRKFDSALDCGLFHVFSDKDRTQYVAGLSHVVKPDGRLFLQCFSNEEPEGQGPRRISQAELRTAFADSWEIESITATRFANSTKSKERNFTPGGPKSWFAVIRRL